ncbi:hypothetical protein [Porphyrobacter sp. YT40]|uniref:hypothetical protein n=1 Tax=Porphyrobacter sp. YT40 TaxID=2547601 RepID=UPI0025722429|nr:hypothetical protein [Porphyrobacter sp. YT40]
MKAVLLRIWAAFCALGLIAQPLCAKERAPLEIKDNGALDGAQQVAIVSFNVGFIFESVDQTQKTGGLMGAFGGTTKARSELVGVTPEMMQQITDAAYADFVAKLAARGITVVEADFSQLSGDKGPSEERINLEKKSTGKAVFYAPSALPVQVFLRGDVAQRKSLANFGDEGRIARNTYAVENAAKANGIPAVGVVYLVDFSDQKRPGAFSFGGSLKVNANLSVVPEFSRLTVIGANGKKNEIVLKQPVSVDGEFVEVSDAMGKREKTVQGAANVLGGLAANSGIKLPMIGKTRKFAFTAIPENYQSGAIALAEAANDTILGPVGR